LFVEVSLRSYSLPVTRMFLITPTLLRIYVDSKLQSSYSFLSHCHHERPHIPTSPRRNPLSDGASELVLSCLQSPPANEKIAEQTPTYLPTNDTISSSLLVPLFPKYCLPIMTRSANAPQYQSHSISNRHLSYGSWPAAATACGPASAQSGRPPCTSAIAAVALEGAPSPVLAMLAASVCLDAAGERFGAVAADGASELRKLCVSYMTDDDSAWQRSGLSGPQISVYTVLNFQS
jgi:hypothetical protein